MANYYTKFSFVIPASQEAIDCILNLRDTITIMLLGQDDPSEIVVPPELRSVIPPGLQNDGVLSSWNEFRVTQSPDGLWFMSNDGAGGLPGVIALIQHLLATFDDQRAVAFAWSYDCSKPRLDGYGGGACVVQASSVTFVDTNKWIKDRLVDLPNVINASAGAY